MITVRSEIGNRAPLLARFCRRENEGDTVGGLVYELLEHVPAPDEWVEYEGFKFLVEAMKDRRIRTVHISPVAGPNAKNGEEARS